MPFSPRHIVIPVRPLGGGVNYIPPSNLINDDEASDVSNFDIRGSRLRVRGGMTAAFRSELGNDITGLYDVRFESGTRRLMLADKAYFQVWDGTSVSDISDAGAMSGSNTDSDIWSFCTSTNLVFATNGINELLYWSGTGKIAKVISLGGYAGPGSLTGKYVVSFAGRPILLGADTVQTRVRWPAAANPADWDDAALLGAGAADLADSPGAINGGIVLGDLLYVFKDDAIVIGRATGDVNEPLVFPTYLKVGCLTGFSAQAIDPNTVAFLGLDNVYIISGGQTKPIGDKIAQDLLAHLNYASLSRVVSWTEPARAFYCLAIPDSSAAESTLATRCYVYNWLEDKWSVRSYPTGLACVAPSTAFGTAMTWTGASGTWTASPYGRWWDQRIVPATPTLYSSHSINVSTLNTGASDNSDAIPNYWCSKDIRLNPDGFASLYAVDVEYSSYDDTTLILSVSSDRGATWSNSYTTTAPAGTNAFIRLPARSTGLFHRVKISFAPTATNLSGVELHSMDLVFTPRQPLRT